MAALRAILALVVLGVPSPVLAGDLSPWRGYIGEASGRFGVPAPWIERVIEAESGGRTTMAGRPIVSRAGAMGLMQLMPSTWSDIRARLGLGADPHDPRDNILAGTFYLRLMYDTFGYPGLFGAYNAGPRRYAQYRDGGRPLPAETRAYMAAVTGRAPSARPPEPVRARGQIFFALSHRDPGRGADGDADAGTAAIAWPGQR